MYGSCRGRRAQGLDTFHDRLGCSGDAQLVFGRRLAAEGDAVRPDELWNGDGPVDQDVALEVRLPLLVFHAGTSSFC